MALVAIMMVLVASLSPATAATCTGSTYSDGATDGTFCKACPAGSFTDGANPRRCIKCVDGRKCCTVGAGSGCPACKAGTKASKATSVFALETAAPGNCLTSLAARCSPYLYVTVTERCSIQLTNDYSSGSIVDAATVACPWRVTYYMKGARPSIRTASENANVTYRSYNIGSSPLNSSKVAAKSPYLDFTLSDKCTLRYRALTNPVAALLGAPPRPAKPGTCPRGQYRDTTSDTAPGPCLPCSPGTYASAPGTCTLCQAGTYAAGYSAKSCIRCPKNQSSRDGSMACGYCPKDQYAARDGTCQLCPSGSLQYSREANKCLAIANGNVCCAAGDCGKDPKCRKLQPSSAPYLGSARAVLQVAAVNNKGAACKNATFMRCLKGGGLVLLEYALANSVSIYVTRLGPLCPRQSPPVTYIGGYAGSSQGYVLGRNTTAATDSLGYQLVANAATGTVTVTATSARPDVVAITSNPTCSATLKLIVGSAFNLRAPANAKCPPTTFQKAGKKGTYCDVCYSNQYLSKGKCATCPKGTYAGYYGATKCTPCPAGSYCPLGTNFPMPCPRNTYSSKAGAAKCAPCPKGRKSARRGGATTCKP